MVFKNQKTEKWEVRCYYKDYKGIRKQKTKRGFRTKSEALDWERHFKLQEHQDLDMTIEDFFELYKRDVSHKVRPNTWEEKENIILTKILPYIGKRKINELKITDVFEWQREIKSQTTKAGKSFSQSYLKTIHNQLSAMLNHAVRYYGLKWNVASKAGTLGSGTERNVDFWTQKEYQKFIEQVSDKPQSFYGFEILYWCGLRIGELLALTPKDFDFENNILKVTKSYKRVRGEDIVTDPKTQKSIRNIVMPNFLADEIKEYLSSIYGIGEEDTIFQNSKSYFRHEMVRGSKAAGVKRIRVHDLRHSHVSYLIDKGYTALAIADRLGHEAVDITYRYAHLFPTVQTDMAKTMDEEREVLLDECQEQ